ncbi:MAG: WcaI family glycosyltransferase [Opitutaceae bacterium]|nr:WcaI family glycosyltransferase [Opitutaceae bacterium]
MRIVVWGINYTPEVTGIAPYNTGLCRFLASRGHEVHMVSTFAYYPQWRKAEADRGQWFRDETDGPGVHLHRCWHYVPVQPSTLRRIAHELSFGLTSLWRTLRLPRAEVYVVVGPPLVLGPIAWVASRLKRSRYVFHVQDLQPDAALGLGMVKPGLFTKLLFAVEGFTYRHAALVSGISQGMLDAFTRKGVPEAKRWYFPNWVPDREPRVPAAGAGADPARTAATSPVAAFRAAHGIAPDAFLAVYSGNVGNKQGLGVLLDAAGLLARDAGPGAPAIEIVIAGDGAAKAALAARHAELGLRRVRLLPLLSDTDYRAMLAATDLALITQEKGTGQFFFPSKMLTVLGAGLPVLAVADDDSELALAVRQGDCGFLVPPGDPERLAQTLRDIAAAPPADFAALRTRGADFVATFSARFVLPAFETRLKILVKTERAR